MIAPTIKKILSEAVDPVVIELGAMDGAYTKELFACCKGEPTYYAFEPDPRNFPHLVELPAGVILIPAAAGNVTGCVPFHLAAQNPNGEFGSSSLSPFKDVAKEFPWCKEVGVVEVHSWRLDDFFRSEAQIDLIFADIQGAERLMIDGARETLTRTRWLWTEFGGVDECDGFYEHSASLKELKALLPGWEVVEIHGGDALLRNALFFKTCPRCGSSCRKHLTDDSGHWEWRCNVCIWQEFSG